MTEAQITNFSVVTDDVRSTSSYVVNTVQEIENELDQLRSFVAGTQEFWKGSDQAAFIDLMARFDQNAKSLDHALSGIADGLRGNAENYDATGSTNTTTMQTLTNNLPPASF